MAIKSIRRHIDNIENAVNDLDRAIRELTIDEDGLIETDYLENAMRDISTEITDLSSDMDDVENGLEEVLN